MFERSIRRQLSLTGMMLGCLLTGIIALASDEPPVGKTPGAEDSQTPRRWAIVSADAKSAALADLLTVELSRWKQVALVERQQITKVLNELQLNASGLVAPDQAVRFGQLSRADALLLLAAHDEPRPGSARVQLVESSTSVRLLDLLIPSANLQRELEAILSELRRADSKLAVSEDRRRFIGVLAINSEEPGAGLKAQCRTLQALVEIRLQQHPQFVVLEREQLQRLTAESNLTGAELKIRSAAWLIEAGVRRGNGGQGFAISCRLLSPASGQRRTLQIEVESNDLAAVQARLAAEVQRAIGGEGENAAGAVDLVAEAAAFARRRDWLQGGYRYEEAAEMAEAALALAPTPENLRKALSSYSLWAHALQGRLDSHGALPAARRFQELRLEWFRKTAEGSPFRVGVSKQPFEPHVRIPLKGDSSEDQSLRAETDKLSEEFFDLAYAEAERQPQRRLELLLHRLEFSTYLAQTGREFAESLPPLIAKIDKAFRELGVERNLRDKQYQVYAGLLFDSLRTSRENTDPAGRSTDERDWERRELEGLWKQLATHDDPVMRFAGLSALVSTLGRDGERAATELLDVVTDWPTLGGSAGFTVDSLVRQAVSRLPPERAQAFVEQLVSHAEEQRDAAPLLLYRTTISVFLGRLKPEPMRAWGERIVAALERSSVRPDQAVYAAGLRRTIEGRLESKGLRPPKVFSIADGEGPWQGYVARPIAIKKSPENGSVWGLYVDRRPAAQEQGDLVLAWSRRSSTLSIERVGLAGGTPRKLGPDIPGMHKAFHGVQVAMSPDVTFVASDTPGFIMLRPGGYEVVDEAQGAPASEVFRLAWLKDRLYVAYRDALASFEPKSRSFQLIASSITVEPRNALDGNGSFFVLGMFPDEANHCLWLEVQDNVLPRARTGIWKFEPQSNRFERIHSGRDWLSWTEGGWLVHLSGHPTGSPPGNADPLKLYSGGTWSLIDPRSSRLTAIPGYGPSFVPFELRVPATKFVKVGEHIIDEHGQLYTSDGKRYRVKSNAKWDRLQRVGSGFITHFDEQANALWYIEPKKIAPSPSRDEPKE